MNRPGGLLGGAGADGGFSADRSNDPAYGGGAAQNSGFNRPGANTDDAASKTEINKVAPIPNRPGIYPPQSTVHLGKVTFVVKFRQAIPVAAAAAEAQ